MRKKVLTIMVYDADHRVFRNLIYFSIFKNVIMTEIA
jgi:hypothetical protein